MRARRTSVLTVVVAVLVAVPAPAGAKAPRARLASFDSCAALLSYARGHAARIATAAGIPMRAVGAPPPVVNGPAADGRGPEGAPVATTSPGADAHTLPDYSDTNVQESGVNEPDIVKTDGRRLFAVAGGRLYGVDLTGDVPRVVGSLELPGYGQELLLRGDRLLAITSAGRMYVGGPVAPGRPVAPAASVAPFPSTGATTLTEIDVRDVAAMKVRRTEAVDGYLVDARQHGDFARVVVATPPRPIGIGPLPPGATPVQARAAERRAIRRTRLATWMPRKRFASRLTGRRFDRRAVGCRDVRRPAQFSGTGMLTVLTVDFTRGLPVRDSTAVLSDATTVYASKESLYVATERWASPDAPADALPAGRATTVHRFALDGPVTTYRSSGLVMGFLLNQFSLSERKGTLRVATTTDPEWWNGRPQADSQSYVTALAERGDRLAELGRLGGLGKGERIYAVRFLDDQAFVVTFRQVDPLFAIDLSDATHPRLAGELDLLGFSSYLHPAGDGLLLGIGQSASPQGRTEGTQLQLFDVSDLSNPRRIAQAKLGSYASSEAEYDHHAFLFWPATGLAVVPVATSSGTAAVGFDARRDGGLREVGRITHDGGAAAIRRALVVGPRVLTLSDAGVGASRLDTLADVAWAPFHS